MSDIDQILYPTVLTSLREETPPVQCIVWKGRDDYEVIQFDKVYPFDTIDDIRNGDEPEPTPQPLPVIIPNVMSSNNDNVNDFLKIKNLNTWRTNKLTIYNRWGRVVYEKFDYNNDWDGYNVPAGVYYGTLEVNFETQHEIHIFNVTIIK
jgi:gliding motility-associated-like protein